MELHKELAKDLVHMRTFYTREYNHKRLGMKLSETTMDKSMERIQGTAKLLVGATYMPRTRACILGLSETTVIVISQNVDPLHQLHALI